MDSAMLLVYGAPLALIWGWYIARRQRTERRHAAVRERSAAAGFAERRRCTRSSMRHAASAADPA